ncbi:hypothetical protein ACJ41P_20530 [Azospirillum argentinense]|uniref:Uncharacterized protein n=1 Tax=Azospirillum argentinense TaxID=2970906 RepID=A0ABW8VDS4_9PROT
MYQLTAMDGHVRRLTDNAIIPADKGNLDYRAYQEWLEAGNAPAPAPLPDDPTTVPVTVTPLQARKALRAAGLKAAADAFIATLPEEEQEEWDYAIEVRRDNAIIAKAAAHLGLDDDRIDALFRRASTFA